MNNAIAKKTLFQHLRAHRSSRWALYILGSLTFFSVFYPVIVNDEYLVGYSAKNEISFPAFSGTHDSENYKSGIPALIPYKATTISKEKLVPPFFRPEAKSWYYTHWLGTDDIGRDVLAGVISASRTAVLVAFFASVFTLLIGGIIGVVSGFFGNKKGSLSILSWILLVLLGITLVYCQVYLTKGIFLFILVLVVPLIGVVEKYFGIKRFNFPWDTLSLKAMEIADSVPSLLILLVLLAICNVSTALGIGFIIALLRWPSIARYLRADLAKVREEDYIKTTDVMGISTWCQITRHALPNAAGATMVSLAFGAGVSILLEASLSFLGLGLSAELVTWGSLLSDAKDNINAWWLAVFPGIMLFIVIYSFNILADKINLFYEK